MPLEGARVDEATSTLCNPRAVLLSSSTTSASETPSSSSRPRIMRVALSTCQLAEAVTKLSVARSIYSFTQKLKGAQLQLSVDGRQPLRPAYSTHLAIDGASISLSSVLNFAASVAFGAWRCTTA